MVSNRKTNTIILIIFGILFSFSSIITTNLNYVMVNSNQSSKKSDDVKASNISGRIHIDNNWTAAESAGICTGNGTYSDPYIIEDLKIDANGLGGILIGNSTVYFKIENCTIYDAGWSYIPYFCYPEESGAIALLNVSNGQINDNTCINSSYGIYLDNGYNNTIFANILIGNNWRAMCLSGTNNTISGNTINNNIYGITLSGSNNIIKANTVNNNENHGISISGGCADPCLTCLECSNNTISGNTINNNSIGIRLEFANNNTISGNTINHNYMGIELYAANNNTISGNTLIGNDECIVEGDDCTNIFENNDCLRSGGIFFELIILILAISGGAVIGVAILLSIRHKRKIIE